MIDHEVIAVAERYIEEHLVPDNLGGDATHLAVACIHEMDYLLTLEHTSPGQSQ